MIKITGGKFKRKKIYTITKIVRPTSSIKREAFFSVIESYGLKNSYNFYNGKTFLDLFAGIGTMGLEAISRGIENVIFYEKNKDVIKILEKNCIEICKYGHYQIINEDLLSSNLQIKFDNVSLIYIDPPYLKYNINNLLEILKKRINNKTIIGIETSIKDTFKIPNDYKLIIKKKFGKTNLSFLILT